MVKDVDAGLILENDITDKICLHITLTLNKSYKKDPTALLQTKPTS